MTALASSQAVVEGFGLELRPWDDKLIDQMLRWGERGFPYHPFDLGRLRDPALRAAQLARTREEGPHRHYVACEKGRAVGRVAVNLRDPAGLYLWAVHVPPEQEGRAVCRRMLAALMTSLEEEFPSGNFVLSTNSFAAHAHRAYQALGFEQTETRWHFDREIADQLWRVPQQQRAPIAHHIRFQAGQWQVRVFIMKRERGAPMVTSVRRSHPL